MNLLKLPPELLSVCLTYLQGHHLASVAQTCKLLQQVADLDFLWQKRCCNEYGLESLDGWNATYKEVYGKVLHKYGYLLGLWRSKTNCYGGLFYIRYGDGGCIVAEEHFAQKDVRGSLKKKRIFNIRLDEDKKVHEEWCAGQINPHPCRTSLERGRVNKSLSGSDKTMTVQLLGLGSKIAPNEREKALFLEECDVRGTHPELCMFRWQTYIKNHTNHSFVQIHLPDPLPTEKVLLQPGLFKGMYGGHGTEIVLLTYDLYHNKANAMKISGDPNVPAGEISISADLSRPMVLTAEQQGSVRALKDLDTDDDVPSDTVKSGKQAFVIPHDVSVEDEFTYPKHCIARYHSQGTVSPMGFKNPSKIANHFIIFDENTFGMLWLDLYTFALFSRVEEHFKTSNKDFP